MGFGDDFPVSRPTPQPVRPQQPPKQNPIGDLGNLSAEEQAELAKFAAQIAAKRQQNERLGQLVDGLSKEDKQIVFDKLQGEKKQGLFFA